MRHSRSRVRSLLFEASSSLFTVSIASPNFGALDDAATESEDAVRWIERSITQCGQQGEFFFERSELFQLVAQLFRVEIFQVALQIPLFRVIQLAKRRRRGSLRSDPSTFHDTVA